MGRVGRRYGRAASADVTRGALVFAVGVAMGAALVLVSVERIDPGQAGAIVAAGIGVLLYLALRDPSPSP